MKEATITRLCRLSGWTRQAYYQGHRPRQRKAVQEERVIEFVRQERAQQPRLGTRKLHVLLKAYTQSEGPRIGRDRLFEVLRRHDLLVRRKKKSVRTTYYDQSLPVYRNLLYEREATAAHQVWVSDITYIETDEGNLYLSLVTDLSSRKIVGWNVADNLTATESVKALQKAIAQLPEGRWPIHHSDRGSQYCCHEYVTVLKQRGLSVSMTEENHCYENCYAERVNGILKDEYNVDYCFRTKAHARLVIEQSIHLYNHRRPHTSLQMLTPAAAHNTN